MYKHFFKRCFDFIIALVALICLAPLLLIVTLWLHFANKGGGAFFLQERPGRHAKIFRVIKFKTMSDERDANGRLLPDEQRLTRVGRFVRSTSIDELPQFINVLKGDMSLIGTPDEKQVADAWLASMRDILTVKTQAEIPELNIYQCGTYTEHSLAEAHEIAHHVITRGVGVNDNADLALDESLLKKD